VSYCLQIFRVPGCPWGGFRGLWVEARKLAFYTSQMNGQLCVTGGRLGTGHTGACEQCADAMEAGIGADALTHVLHMCKGNWGLGRAKGGDGAAYVMPDT